MWSRWHPVFINVIAISNISEGIEWWLWKAAKIAKLFISLIPIHEISNVLNAHTFVCCAPKQRNANKINRKFISRLLLKRVNTSPEKWFLLFWLFMNFNTVSFPSQFSMQGEYFWIYPNYTTLFDTSEVWEILL